MKTKSRSTHQLPALEFMAYIRSPQQKSFIADSDVGARLAIIAVLSVFATACSDLPTTQSVLKRGPRYELSGSGLIPLPGAGLDINDQDWVVGTTMEGQAFLWRDGYPIQELGPDAALGLNSTNQIVGGEWFPRPLFPGDDNEHFAGP